jgi:Holliday junction resolvasome RuvABC endonuclease subunit
LSRSSADSEVVGPVEALDVDQRAGDAAWPAVEGHDHYDSPSPAEHGRAAALAVLEPGRVPASDPLRLQQHVILALDLGQRTGWAVRNADGAIASGTVEFRPGRFESVGMIYLRFRAWLQEVDETAGGIGAVYFEEVRAHRGVIAAQSYGAFLGHLTAWAEMFKIPYRGVPVGTIKRHVTGRGNADKGAVVAAVRALGFDPADDNEADALALLDWALKHGGRR